MIVLKHNGLHFWFEIRHNKPILGLCKSVFTVNFELHLLPNHYDHGLNTCETCKPSFSFIM